MRSFDYKLDRALEHLGALEAISRRFFEDNPCLVSLEGEVQTCEHILIFRVLQEPPRLFTTIATDCIHNLRQALDHIAYRLAIHISGCDPPPNEANIYFPIAATSQQFEGKLGSSFGSTKRIPTDIRTALEGVQCYMGPDGDLLPILEDLDNFDKHRFPPTIAVGGLVPSFNIGTLSVTKLIGPRLGPVKPNTEILRFVPIPGTPVDMNFPATHLIAFGEGKPGEGRFVIPMLHAVRDLIRLRLVEPLDAYL